MAKLALRLPQVLEELRAGTLHLTGLFLLSSHLTEDNAAALLDQARGKSRRQIEELIARWFPRPDVSPSLEPVSSEGSPSAEAEQLMLGNAPPPVGPTPRITCSKTREGLRSRLEPLSPTRWRVEFTARAELYDKLERARELLSHAVPSGDLGELFERALDALIEQETRKRFGAGKPRKARTLKPGSRHVPVAIQRAVWERDQAQCTFVDGEGQRCAERRFLTLEHRTPFALGGAPTLENLCLLCRAHNLENARLAFGKPHIAAKIREKKLTARTAPTSAPERLAGRGTARADQPDLQVTDEPPLEASAKVLSSLCGLGFGRREASAAIGQALGAEPRLDVEQLLRRCLLLLLPKAS